MCVWGVPGPLISSAPDIPANPGRTFCSCLQRISGGPTKAVFLVVGIGLHRRGDVARHIAGSVIQIVRAGGVQPVVGIGGDAQILCAAFGDGLLQQVAPGVIAVRVTPVFGLVLKSDLCDSSLR